MSGHEGWGSIREPHASQGREDWVSQEIEDVSSARWYRESVGMHLSRGHGLACTVAVTCEF